MTTVSELQKHIHEQNKEIFDLIAKVIDVIATHGHWSPDDGSYKFTDGEVWHRFDPDYELAKNASKPEDTT